eukprot:gb/GEZN01001074.1/.p1 GENE.gb/GEZN01001074.1/~~gb/GEZN01001074.1/.p1  ORF type:complete len:1007 (+),score=126.68 gb/GEZN01001074.1/:110-3130(+)
MSNRGKSPQKSTSTETLQQPLLQETNQGSWDSGTPSASVRIPPTRSPVDTDEGVPSKDVLPRSESLSALSNDFIPPIPPSKSSGREQAPSLTPLQYEHQRTGAYSAPLHFQAPDGRFNPDRMISPSQIFRQPSFNFRLLKQETNKLSGLGATQQVSTPSTPSEIRSTQSPREICDSATSSFTEYTYLQDALLSDQQGFSPANGLNKLNVQYRSAAHLGLTSEGRAGKLPLGGHHKGEHDDVSVKVAKFRRRLGYYVPVFGWLPKYSFRDSLADDALAGLTASVILIPQGITYAGLANLPPIYGLYSAFFPLLAYFIFGSGRHLSMGPEVTSSILVGKSVLAFPSVEKLSQDSPNYQSAVLSAAMALTFTVGLVGLAMGFLRMGFVDSMLSRPILAGFVQAVAAILILDQMPYLLGLPCKGDDCSPDNSPFALMGYCVRNAQHINLPTLLVSFCCIVTMLGFPVLKGRFPSVKALQVFPEVLLVVVVATVCCWGLQLEDQGVKVLGYMEGGFSMPRVPKLGGHETKMLTDAMTIMLLGFVESQIANKTSAGKYGYTVSPNRELVALGVSNLFGSFFGSFCAFGSIPRSEMLMARGQKSNVAMLVTCVLIFCAILFVLPLFHYTPKAVTGSIIFVVALGLIEVHELKFIVRVRKWVDLAMAFAMTAVTLIWGIDMGVFFAFGSCLLMAVKQTTLPALTVLGRGDNDDDYRDLMDLDEHTTKIDGVLIYKVDGALFFANAQKLKESTQRMEKWGNMHVHPSEDHVPLLMSAVIFDVSQLISVDATALATFLEIVQSYTVMKRRVALVGLRKCLKLLFQRAGILRHVSAEDMFSSLPAAVAAMTASGSFINKPRGRKSMKRSMGDSSEAENTEDTEDDTDQTETDDDNHRLLPPSVSNSQKVRDPGAQRRQKKPAERRMAGGKGLNRKTSIKGNRDRVVWPWPILRMMNMTWNDDHAEDELHEDAYGDLAPPRPGTASQRIGARTENGFGSDHFQPMIAYEAEEEESERT